MNDENIIQNGEGDHHPRKNILQNEPNSISAQVVANQ